MNNIVTLILSKQEYLKDFITRFTYELTRVFDNKLNNAEIYALIFDRTNFVANLYSSNDVLEVVNIYICLDYIFSNENKYDLNEEKADYINKLLIKSRTYEVVEKKGTFFKENLKTAEEEIDRILETYNSLTSDIYHSLAYLYSELYFNKIYDKDNLKTIIFLVNYELIKNNLFPIVLSKNDIDTIEGYVLSKNSEGIAKKIRELVEIEQQRCNTFK